MHEIGIVQSVLDMATQAARRAGAARVHRLKVRVGALSGVVPEALQFAFDALRPGSVAAEALLELEWVPVAYWCAKCESEFSTEEDECPGCHEFSSEMRHGLELELTSLEVS